MATPLDIGFLSQFQFIFPFLLVLALVYGILSYTKVFGDNKTVYAIISVALAIIMLFSSIARETINMMAPWFVILFFFLVFLLVGIRIFGVSELDVVSYMKGDPQIAIWVVALALIIGFGSLTTVIAKQGGIGAVSGNATGAIQAGEAEGDQRSEFWATIVHPKILGMILILLIASFSVHRITKSP